MRSRDEVPLLKTPERSIPPVATGQPGTIRALYHIAALAKEKHRRAVILQGDGGGLGRTKPPHGSAWLRCNGGRIAGGHGERLHTKAFGRVRVLKHGAANALFADDGAYAGEGYVQPRCFGELRLEGITRKLQCQGMYLDGNLLECPPLIASPYG